MLTKLQVEAIGGRPSNKSFSTYFDICKLLGQIDDLPREIGGGSNFYSPTEEQLITKLKSNDQFQRYATNFWKRPNPWTIDGNVSKMEKLLWAPASINRPNLN
jgi:hypothetical protein